MNDIRIPDREALEIGRIRGVVERFAFPDFVNGFDVKLGEFDDEPAMWIIFHTTGVRPALPDDRTKRVDQLRRLKDSVHRGLLSEFEDRYPYYQFANPGQVSPGQ